MSTNHNDPMQHRFTRGVSAVYRPSTIPAYRGNPLIEALPPILSNKDWTRILSSKPDHSENERNGSQHERIHKVLALTSTFVVLPRHQEFREQFDMILRHGYINMPVNRAGRQNSDQALYEAMMAGDANAAHMPAPSDPECFSVVGFSGIGKSFTTARYCAYLPNSIRHEALGILQIPVLLVQCPHRGSTRQVALAILDAIDRITGTSYKTDYRRLSEDELTLEIAHLLDHYFVGALVLDELQNISMKKSGGQGEFLNFFLLLLNQVKRPTVFIGTMKAIKVLQQTFRTARRQSSLGTKIWLNLKFDGEWNKLLTALWPLQWTRVPSPMTPALSEKLYELTQGVPSLLIRLLVLAQIRAIRLESKQMPDGPLLDERLLTAVAQENFSSIQPMLDAIRSGDPAQMARYEDIALPSLDEMTAIRGLTSRTDLGETLDPASLEQQNLTVAAKAREALRLLGVPEPESASLTAVILAEQPFLSAQDVTIEVLARMEKTSRVVRPTRGKAGRSSKMAATGNIDENLNQAFGTRADLPGPDGTASGSDGND